MLLDASNNHPTITENSVSQLAPGKTQLQGRTHSCKQSNGSQANLTKGPFSSVYKSCMALCRNQRMARKQDFPPASAFCFWKTSSRVDLSPQSDSS